jgi:hypothetical protein
MLVYDRKKATLMPTKKRVPEDRETEAYRWRWGLDAATAAAQSFAHLAA